MRRLIGSLGNLLPPVRVAFWVLLMLVATVSTQFSQATASQIAKRNTYAGEVVLVRGGFGVFSNGLDKIASSLGRRGITAKVYSHTQTNQIARSIISNQKRYGRKPIILVGHSWGANSVIKIAGLLKRARLRVNYVATITATDPVAAPSNIQKLTNYYFSKGGWGKPVSPAPGF